MRLTRGTWFRISAIGAGALVLLSGTPLSGAATGTPLTASQELQAATAAANSEGSVRITVHFFSGHSTGELVQDTGLSTGVQTVAIGKERISIVLIKGVAYFSGNNQGLTKYFGLPQTLASRLSGRWISVTAADSGYQSIINGLTLSSAIKEVAPTGTIALGKRSKVNGQSTVSVVGLASGGTTRITLFVAASGKPLPVEAASSGGTGTQKSGEIIAFSRWGEKVHVPRPTRTIPISSLKSTGSSPG
ncbi:MAG TPA: hypothetical protein VNG12_10355 [Acidimicrobiales bacterium]|nr:hypothetical protein [Acidimicrobiales bacterium]